jgi:hypothetical protein
MASLFNIVSLHHHRSLEGKEEILIFRKENASKFALFLRFAAPFAAQAFSNLRTAMMIDDTARSGIVGLGGGAKEGVMLRPPLLLAVRTDVRRSPASTAFIKSNQRWPH